MTGHGVFAAALLDPGAPCPDGLRAWNGSDPAARFAVYRNNIVHSLVDALAETFPVSRELVGDEFFRAMAKVFVLASPPRSCVLSTYGESFPGFVEHFEPARSVPYLADVARIEMARVRAFHAADAGPVAAGAIADALAAPDLAPMLRVTCHPSLSVVRSSYAAVSLWAAHQGIGDIGDVDPDDAEDALVVRRELEVEVVRLPAGGAMFVQDLLAGRSLGDAAARARAGERAFDLAANLALLMRVDAIATLALPERQSP